MRRSFDSLSYVQSGNYCVLASYAAALWPWMRVSPHNYFVAYCEHFRLQPAPGCAEAVYLSDFVARYDQSGMSGYRVLFDLHQNSTHDLFVRARAAASASYVASVATDVAVLEAALLGAAPHTLMVFVNQSAFAGLESMHSISMIGDGTFWHFDVNVGRLLASAASLSHLGNVGEGILFRGLAPLLPSA